MIEKLVKLEFIVQSLPLGEGGPKGRMRVIMVHYKYQ